MRGSKLLRVLRASVVPAAIILTATALVFAIYFTESNMQWAAFLTGILVAAVLA